MDAFLKLQQKSIDEFQRVQKEREKDKVQLEKLRAEINDLRSNHQKELDERDKKISQQTKLISWTKQELQKCKATWEEWCKGMTDKLRRENNATSDDNHVDGMLNKSTDKCESTNAGCEESSLKSSDSDMYAEKVVDSKENPNGLTIYRVRWLGCGPDEDTWEPHVNIFATGIIDKYAWDQRNKDLREGMPGTAILEYSVPGGAKERMLVDARQEIFRPYESAATDWELESNYSLIKKGSMIDLYWQHAGYYHPCQVISWTPFNNKPMPVKKVTHIRKDVLASPAPPRSSAILGFEQELEKYCRQRKIENADLTKLRGEQKSLQASNATLKVALEEESIAKTKAQNRLRLLKGNYEESINDLNSDYKQQFSNAACISMERENKIRIDNEKLMSEMKMEHANELSDVRTQHANELSDARAQHTNDLSSARAYYSYYNSQDIQRLERQLAALRDVLSQAGTKWKTHYEGQITRLSERNKELSDEIIKESEVLAKPSDLSVETTLEDVELEEGELVDEKLELTSSGLGSKKNPPKKRKFCDEVEV